MPYPTSHPFNNAPVDPMFSYWNENGGVGLVIGFCSPGAAVPLPVGAPLYNPMDWQGGTMWQLVNPPLHWTSNCFTGLTVIYVDDGGDVWVGDQKQTPSAHWPGGYIFKDLPNVKTLAIGYNLSWDGTAYVCSVSFSDLKADRRGVNGRSGAMYPNMYGAASGSAMIPFYSFTLSYADLVQVTSIVQDNGGGAVVGSMYFFDGGACWGEVNGGTAVGESETGNVVCNAPWGEFSMGVCGFSGYSVVEAVSPQLVDALAVGYELIEAGGYEQIEIVPSNYTFPMWIGSALGVAVIDGDLAPKCGLPYTELNQIFYFSAASIFSEVPLNNGYSLYVFALAGARV